MSGHGPLCALRCSFSLLLHVLWSAHDFRCLPSQFDKLRQLLTTFGARPFLAMVDSAGNNALHFACMYGCAEAVAVVLEFAVLSDARRGEDCNELQSQLFLPNAHGYAPEVLALKQGFEAVFRSVFRAHHGFEADSEVCRLIGAGVVESSRRSLTVRTRVKCC